MLVLSNVGRPCDLKITGPRQCRECSYHSREFRLTDPDLLRRHIELDCVTGDSGAVDRIATVICNLLVCVYLSESASGVQCRILRRRRLSLPDLG